MNAVNDAPVTSDFSVATDEDVTYTFTSTDFTNNFSDVDGDSLSQVKIMSLPSGVAGVLKYNGTAVTVNQVVAVANIGLLTFDPVADYNGSPTFTYQARDASLFSATSTVTVSVGATNDAPTVSNTTETTNEDTTYTYILADFTSAFADTDGDSLTKIKIVTLPNATH